jgi:hypothetical protein
MYAKKGWTTQAIAKQWPSVRSDVRTGGFSTLEQHFYDTGVVSGTPGITADMASGEIDPAGLLCISAPADGNGPEERRGNEMVITSVNITGHIAQGTTTTNTVAEGDAAQVYVALVLDTQTNGSQLSSEDVFTNPSGNAANIACPLRNLEHRKRFRVLKKWVFEMPGASADSGASAYLVPACDKSFECYLKLRIPVNFNDAAEGIASVNDNSLHMIAFCNTGRTSNIPLVRYNARIRMVG